MLKIMSALLSAALLSALLAACGGGADPASSTAQPPRQAATQVAAPADYSDAVQLFYIAYFGRPADKAGLENFTNRLATAGVAADVQALDFAYNTNPAVRALVDSFGNSDESRLFLPGDTRTYVGSVYTHLLNRAPLDSDEGKTFWVNAIDRNGLPRSRAALSILAGAMVNNTAQGRIDNTVINNKLAVARAFTAAVPVSAYQGNVKASGAITMLAGVTQSTTLASYQPTINSTVERMSFPYAGTYSGRYTSPNGAPGAVHFTISIEGAVSGTIKPDASNTSTVLQAKLLDAGAVAMKIEGTIGADKFTGGVTVFGNFTGEWTTATGAVTMTGNKID